jgi:mannose-6-phosphate isomerase-like protein (cupin superfamily)
MDIANSPRPHHFGQELRQRRESKGLSLDRLAQQVGLAPGELQTLESQASSPPLSTLWKIAGALDIPFSQLLGRRTPVASLARRAEVEVLHSDDGKVQSRPLVTTALCRWVEVYEITIDRLTKHVAEAHARGTEEIVVIQRGQLTIRIDQEIYDLGAGDSLAFVADVPHVYENRGEEPVTFHDIIAYAR